MINLPLKTPKLDEQFSKYLDGKSVAILGHGPSLGVCNGAEIEKYDVVVRIHGTAPSGYACWGVLPDKDWHGRVGKRTDIYYHNTADAKWVSIKVKEFKEAGGKFWCCENPWVALPYTDVSDAMDALIDYRYPSLELYFATYRLIGSNPIPGTLVLADILRHNVSNVFIGGMTCWIEDMASVGRQDNAHNSWQDFKWMYELWHENDKVKADKTIESLFVEYRDNVRRNHLAVQTYGKKEVST